MDQFVSALTNGVAMLFDPTLLAIVILGSLWGVIGGGHPGGSQVLTVSVVIPITFVMEPVQAVALLLAIVVGVNYGNSIPAILLGVPGTVSAFLTAIDGYSLHRAGKTGLALGIMHVASLTGLLLSILLFIVAVIPLSYLTYVFLTPEFFALFLLGLLAVVSLLGTDLTKGWISLAIGLAVAIVGPDPLSGVMRFTGPVPELRRGLESIPVLLGLLALSELFRHVRQVFQYRQVDLSTSLNFPTRAQFRRVVRPIAIGAGIGTSLSAIPGFPTAAAAVISYNQARNVSKHREEFGHGSVEGIAANEAAQSAASTGDLIPTIGLGIPAGATEALILSVMMLNGVVPGPQLITTNPDILYACVAGMLGSAIVLLLVGWPVAKVMARIVAVDRSVVTTIVIVLLLVGVFALNQSVFDVQVAIIAGLVGYYMRRYGYSVPAASLAVVLGNGLEANLRSGLQLVGNDPLAFIFRPAAGPLLLIGALVVLYGLFQSARKRMGATSLPVSDD